MTRDFTELQRRLVDKLYCEATELADESKDYFTYENRSQQEHLDPLVRLNLACESLKVTTRLLHVIAWLLTQRAVLAGELTTAAALSDSHSLGSGPLTEDTILISLPAEAQRLVRASLNLYRRVRRVEHGQHQRRGESPVRAMITRLAYSF